MFSLSQVLSNEHARVLQAWEKGAPKAETIAQARREWAPMLPTWARYVETDFLGYLTHRVGRERVGWIDDADFWKSFWHASGTDWKVQQESDEFQRIHMQAYIEGAAAAGSLSFFTTMPPDNMEFVLKALSNTGVLIDPDVLDWSVSNAGKIHNNVVFQQLFTLQRLEWSRYAPNKAEQSRGTLAWQETIAVFQKAYCRHSLGNQTTVTMLGHILTVLAKTVEPKLVVDELQRAFHGHLKEDVDLPLIALCCGHDVLGTPRSKSLAQAGAYMLEVPDRRPQHPPEILEMLCTLERIESPYTLYLAVLKMGLHRETYPETNIDGELFVPPMV